GPVRADEDVDVGVVRARVLADERRLAMARGRGGLRCEREGDAEADEGKGSRTRHAGSSFAPCTEERAPPDLPSSARLLPEPGPGAGVGSRAGDLPAAQVRLDELHAREAIVVADDDRERNAVRTGTVEEVREDDADERGVHPVDGAEPRRGILLHLGDANRPDATHRTARRPVGEDLPPAMR